MPRSKINHNQELGAGEEKKVYSDDNPKKVIKTFEGPHFSKDTEYKDIYRSERFVKVQYYLGKIAYLLFPENVPNIHLVSAAEPNPQTINERVNIDKESSRNMYEEPRPGHHSIKNKLLNAGLGVDRSFNNYIVDDKGRIQYIDAFNGWSDDGYGRAKKDFNFFELHNTILSELEGAKKRKALAYLKRAEELYNEEKVALRHKREFRSSETFQQMIRYFVTKYITR